MLAAVKTVVISAPRIRPRRVSSLGFIGARVLRVGQSSRFAPSAREERGARRAPHFRFLSKKAHVRFHESICSGESTRLSVFGLTRRLNTWPHSATLWPARARDSTRGS